jgi:transcriptional regulator with XRE-family HTH domain
MTHPRMVFGRNLRRARNLVGLSQYQLEKACGIDQARISNIETGRVDLGIDTMAKLAEAVGLPMWELCKPEEGGADA